MMYSLAGVVISLWKWDPREDDIKARYGFLLDFLPLENPFSRRGSFCMKKIVLQRVTEIFTKIIQTENWWQMGMKKE